jgi:hypothetical protein
MPAYEPALFATQGRSNVPGTQTFCLELTYGSSAIASAKGAYLAVEDTAAGKMTVTFPRTYRRLTGFRWGWKKFAAGAVYFPVVLTDGIDTASASGGGTLIIETRTEAGTATDPASGDQLLLEFDVTLDVLDDEYAITVTTP